MLKKNWVYRVLESQLNIVEYLLIYIITDITLSQEYNMPSSNQIFLNLTWQTGYQGQLHQPIRTVTIVKKIKLVSRLMLPLNLLIFQTTAYLDYLLVYTNISYIICKFKQNGTPYTILKKILVASQLLRNNLGQWFSKCSQSQDTASASPGNLLEGKFLGHFIPMKSNSGGDGQQSHSR